MGEVGAEDIKVGLSKYGEPPVSDNISGDSHRMNSSGPISIGIVGAMAGANGFTDELRRKDESDFERFKKLDEKYVSDPSINYDNDHTARKLRDESEEDNLLRKGPTQKVSTSIH